MQAGLGPKNIRHADLSHVPRCQSAGWHRAKWRRQEESPDRLEPSSSSRGCMVKNVTKVSSVARMQKPYQAASTLTPFVPQGGFTLAGILPWRSLFALFTL